MHKNQEIELLINQKNIQKSATVHANKPANAHINLQKREKGNKAEVRIDQATSQRAG